MTAKAKITHNVVLCARASRPPLLLLGFSLWRRSQTKLYRNRGIADLTSPLVAVTMDT